MATIKIRWLHQVPDSPHRPGDVVEVDRDDPRVRQWLQNRQVEEVDAHPEQIPAPPPVKVKALQWHTAQGETHEVGDIYDASAELVDTLVVQGKAAPVPDGETTSTEPPPA